MVSGNSNRMGADFSPYLAGCMYAYDKGLMVNVDENGNVQEQTIEISVGGISCEGCKVDMSAKAELAFFFEMNTDSTRSTGICTNTSRRGQTSTPTSTTT